jgi:hypothetical protein
VLIVTGLRALAGAAPMGECELDLTWATGSGMHWCSCSDEARICVGRLGRGDARSVFKRARDMVLEWEAWVWQRG